jgi:hypothetical protein
MRAFTELKRRRVQRRMPVLRWASLIMRKAGGEQKNLRTALL